jgi:hypothetical protein
MVAHNPLVLPGLTADGTIGSGIKRQQTFL